MNVDILESNPDWRWYLLFGGGCLTLTVLVWLIFKYGRVRPSPVQKSILSMHIELIPRLPRDSYIISVDVFDSRPWAQ